MFQRQVGADQVIETLESPDQLISGESGEVIAVKRFGAREVRVAYTETDADGFLIYTVLKPRVHD